MYKNILEQAAHLYENESMQKLTTFLESILEQPFPEPGNTFTVSTLKGFTFTRPNDSDSQLEHVFHSPFFPFSPFLLIFFSLPLFQD